MTTLRDILDIGELERALQDGHVRQQNHPGYPAEPLAILNYAEKCQYAGAWSPTTLTCRGLIVRLGTEEVIARPFAKFFNHGQAGAAEIALDEPVHVTDKMDGCFLANTALNLWGGGTITIGEVVTKRLPVTLVGMDEQGHLVPAVVTDWHNNGRKDHWLDIEVDVPVSRRSGAGGHPNKLRVTVNHHIYINGEYQPAAAIRPGDQLVTQTWAPSEDVVRLVRASLLGDGCLVPSATRPDVAKYQEPHSIKQADYVEALRKALGDCAANRSDTVSGYGSRMAWVGSREYAALGDLRREWYPDGKKRVPTDLSWLDDFAVAKWLMDDGYRAHSPAQRDRIVFATNSFECGDVQRLADRLTELYGVSCTVFEDRGPNLRVNAGRGNALDRLWAAVAPYVHPSMRYKLPERWRDVPYVEMTPGRELVLSAVATVKAVTPVEVSKENFPSGRTGFDITTTTRNYLARGVLVHNSLGILYPTPDGQWAIATRGSFASEQAIHATELLRIRYPHFTPPVGFTVLFEIIYPANRIVCDYGTLDDLVLLGAVAIDDGLVCGPTAVPTWTGPVARTFTAATFADALALPPRPNAEGIVVRSLGTGRMVKIKQDDYVALHRIVTGLNARSVWQHLCDGKPIAAMLDGLPDEFHTWVLQVAEDITTGVDQQEAEAEKAFAEIKGSLPDGFSRRDFAAQAVTHPLKWALFLLLDGRDIRPQLLRNAKPDPYLTPSGRVHSEDVA